MHTFTATRDISSSSRSTAVPATADPFSKMDLRALLTLLSSRRVGLHVLSRSVSSDAFPSPRICAFVMWQRGHGYRPKLLMVAMVILSHELDGLH